MITDTDPLNGALKESTFEMWGNAKVKARERDPVENELKIETQAETRFERPWATLTLRIESELHRELEVDVALREATLQIDRDPKLEPVTCK